jgi:hypothetical protein
MEARLDMCRCQRSQRRSLSVVAHGQGRTIDDIAMRRQAWHPALPLSFAFNV